jgi:hypothetical protein
VIVSSVVSKVVVDFMPQLEAGMTLCLLPVPRIKIENESILLDKFRLYPCGEIDLDSLRIVSYPKQEFEDIEAKFKFEVDGRQVIQVQQPELTWYQSGATKITPADFNQHALIAFASDLKMDRIFEGNHEVHKKIIADHAYEAERAMDTVRFDFCRMDLPATLPGRVGTLGIGSSFSTELFYSLVDHESYILGCENVTHLISCGLGLEFESSPSIQNIGSGEVGHIVRRALAMFSEALESNSETDKFVRAMSAIEFIAGGGEYLNMKKVKTQIGAHCASDKADYLSICKKFHRLTSITEEGTGLQLGYRTLIVHMGKRLEQIIESTVERKKLFQELQHYISKSIDDLLQFSNDSWIVVEAYRSQRLAQLGVQSDSST